jgi:hypothetical protein
MAAGHRGFEARSVLDGREHGGRMGVRRRGLWRLALACWSTP